MAPVSKELIAPYWNIGHLISRLIPTSPRDARTLQAVPESTRRRQSRMSGLSTCHAWRRAQFSDTYQDASKLAPLVRELSWTHNLLILGKCKREEEREFSLPLSHREKWGKRELERQLNGALFERTVLAPPTLSTPLAELHPEAETGPRRTAQATEGEEVVTPWPEKPIGVVLPLSEINEASPDDRLPGIGACGRLPFPWRPGPRMRPVPEGETRRGG